MVDGRQERDPLGPSLRLPGAAWLLLLLSCSLTVAQAMLKPAWIDELLEFYTDTQPSVAAMLHLQRTTPFSLEPATFHLLLHGLEWIFGQSLLVERLPAIACSLLAQYCLFCIVRSLAGERAGLCAMLLPTVTYSRHYFAEGRVYGFLFGVSALALLSWLLAVTRERRRGWPLSLLTICLAVLVTSHYYGVLLLVPLFLAEAMRTVLRRRLDVPMVLALCGGAAMAALDLPFTKAALTYRGHYFAQAVDWHTLPATYEWLFAVTKLRGAVLLALAALSAVAIALALRWQSRADGDRKREETLALASVRVAAMAFVGLPFAGYLLSKLTHAFEPRYVLPTLLGFAIMFAVALAPVLRNNMVFGVVLGLLVLASSALGVREIQRFRRERAELLASFTLPAPLRDAGGAPREVIYLKSVESFLLVHFYRPGQYADRFELLYSPAVELQRLNYDAPARFAEGIAAARPDFHILRYETFRDGAGARLVDPVRHEEAEGWLRAQLLQDGFSLAPEGELLGGTVLLATPATAR